MFQFNLHFHFNINFTSNFQVSPSDPSPIRKRPHLVDLSLDSGGPSPGVVTIEHDGISTRLSVSFCKKFPFSCISDEDGYVSFYDTRRKLPALASCGDNAEAGVYDWVAHHNAIFYVCWIKDDTQVLTASSDQTTVLYLVQEMDLLLFRIYDPSLVQQLDTGRHASIAVVKGAHVSHQRKRGRRGKAANMRITSVLYLKDEISIASAGAVDSIVKFWDTRNLKASIT